MKRYLYLSMCLALGVHSLTLQAKKPKKDVIVAIIGVGVDTTYAPLRQALWTNPAERSNGKDDDHNGLVDDIHGWNFIGTRDGETTARLSHAGDREFFRLKDKYENYLYADGQAQQWDEAAGTYRAVPFPTDKKEFLYFFTKVLPDSPLGQNYLSIGLAKHVISYIHHVDAILRAKYPAKTLKADDFESLFSGPGTEVTTTMHDLVSLLFMSAGSSDWDVMMRYADTKYLPYQERIYNTLLSRAVIDERKAIGDNPYDINDRSYGNANLATGNTAKGTVIAELISRMAPNAKIMPLCIDADYYGEPYMKDMALAIRYAVDHGADIIQMGKTNTLYPQPWSAWVDEALRHAEKKGVLVVMPVMDLSYNLDDQPFYPNRHLSGHDLTNVLTVAASDSVGNPYDRANFSPAEVDLFAPGVDLKMQYANSVATSSEFAAAQVSGVAARMKAKLPVLTPAQIRKVVMETVTPRVDVEVQKTYRQFKDGKSAGLATDLFLFEELCKSGGVLNPQAVDNWLNTQKP